MLKKIVTIALISLLTGCSGGSDDDNNEPECNFVPYVISDATQLLNHENGSVSVTGNGNTLTVTSDSSFCYIEIKGNNNLLDLKEVGSIARVFIRGSDNTVSAYEGTTFLHSFVGEGNEIITEPRPLP